MKKPTALLILSLLPALAAGRAEPVGLGAARLETVAVSLDAATIAGVAAVRVVKDAAVEAFDEPTFARLQDVTFRDGTIEVKVLSRLRPDAPDFARGFIGLAFRINADNTRFESIYIRPTNGRVEDERRRNAAVQYFAYPDFKFDRLRKEAPGRYEAAADIGLNEWITLRIVVRGARASLFINGSPRPALIVNDLKLGEGEGAVGLWVDVGTEGYFTDLEVRHD